MAHVSGKEDDTLVSTDPDQVLLDHVAGIVDAFASTTDDNELPDLRGRVSTLLCELPFSYCSFECFMSEKAKQQDTFAFGCNL